MCFSATHSAWMGALSLFTALILVKRHTSWWQPALFFYFVLMEGLQWAQYQVIDDCKSVINQALTIVVWIHLSFQPLVFSGYLFALDARVGPRRTHFPAVHKFVLQLSTVSVAFLLVKGLVLPLGLVDAGSLPVPLRQCTPGEEHMCGLDTCSFQGSNHVAWRLPMINGGYYMPTIFIHFFLSFVPILIVGTWVVRSLVIVAVLLGPLAVDYFWTGGDAASHHHEMPSIWCLMSVAYAGMALVWEFVLAPLVDPPKKKGAKSKRQ